MYAFKKAFTDLEIPQDSSDCELFVFENSVNYIKMFFLIFLMLACVS